MCFRPFVTYIFRSLSLFSGMFDGALTGEMLKVCDEVVGENNRFTRDMVALRFLSYCLFVLTLCANFV